MMGDQPEWRENILAALRARVDGWIRRPLEIPAQAGGWWHQYVCPEHQLPLIFDLTSPTRHSCPEGDSYQGKSNDAGFRVFAHRHYSALARDAAFLYLVTSKQHYFETSFEVLSHYATLYRQFDGGNDSQDWMLAGKAFSQALTEAVWAVPLAQAFEALRPVLDPPQANRLASCLLMPVAEMLARAHDELVFTQGKLKSNYNAWLVAALGCLGFVLDDNSLVQRAIDGPGGFYNHLNAGVLPDGFEYEGSPYYHNFVVWAYTLLAETALQHGMDLYALRGSQGQSIQGMWHALASLAWPDGSISFLNDGNYWQSSSFDAELCEVYEIALARTGDPLYAWLLDCAYQRRGVKRDSWAGVMFAERDITASPRPALVSTCLENIGLGVLRDPEDLDGLTALLRFGPYGGSHSHRDCLSLLLFPYSLDAGNPPYGVEIRRSWYQQSAAHNVVIVGGQSQTPGDGHLLSWTSEPGRSAIWAAADEAYPGVKFSRRIALESGRISDHTSLSANAKSVFDWLIHADIAPHCENVQLGSAQGTLYPQGAGPFIRLVLQGACPGFLKVAFQLNEQTYRLRLSSPNPFEIFLARSPKRGGLAMDDRYTLIARVRGHQADFFAIYEKV